jgi:formate transporter
MATRTGSGPVISFDAFAPLAIAERVEKAGVAKANLNLWTMFALAILAGSFIALGAEFCTLVITGINIGFGLTKLAGGLVFSLGLILVVVAGAELFTGNNLLTMAWLSGAAPFRRVVLNWIVVFIGNLVGSLALAGLMYLTRQWAAADYGVGATAIKIAADKTALPFLTALARGILCNVLVCLAVWLCFGARSVGDKILAIIFPITAFVASGFEHSVANMYFIPYGLMLKDQPQVLAAAGLGAAQLNSLTVMGFAANLLPVTIGNLIGGGIMVGVMYWFIYLRDGHTVETVTRLEAMPIPRPLALLPEDSAMSTGASTNQTPAVPLFRFNITSADMFHSEVAQRAIYVRDDPDTGFHIWGEITGGAGVPPADLGAVLLEYAMTCAAHCSLPDAYRQMDTFGKNLGEALAVCIIQGTPAEKGAHRATCGLECVLESLNIAFTIQQSDGRLSYRLDHCPLCDTSERSGLHHVELAHHGLSALCHSLIHSLDPGLDVHLPNKSLAEHVFSLTRLDQAA